jgi:hypothetical protein
MERYRADCEQCFGLCCVALPYRVVWHAPFQAMLGGWEAEGGAEESEM